ncbi:hypothetical protein [Chitinophaga nivalis]|uniref:Uncharacterized protein n=1 Tax=Chitinophaga nivalis TaxID=2991709 RepID=A0ABT3IP33_9BACT|nr:hypothetical protein [Chitinophaga nivalis]MCW3464595.1 hypothetical protein [Chitinophaga nivalis]MCW3485714.1 hypothetical protein [Chitinophaga nivalis]
MKKAKFVLLLGIATCVYSVMSIASNKTNASAKNMGLARADKIEINKVDLARQAAFTPVALALACPGVAMAVGTAVLATAGLVGRSEPENTNLSHPEIVNVQLSALD